MPQFTHDRIADPGLLDLSKRVRFEVDPEIESIYPQEFPARVEVNTRNGRSFERYVPAPKGSATNRYSMAEAETKLRSVTTELVDDGLPGRVFAEISDLENAKDVSGLLQALASERA